jgi:hypothetical protein
VTFTGAEAENPAVHPAPTSLRAKHALPCSVGNAYRVRPLAPRCEARMFPRARIAGPGSIAAPAPPVTDWSVPVRIVATSPTLSRAPNVAVAGKPGDLWRPAMFASAGSCGGAAVDAGAPPDATDTARAMPAKAERPTQAMRIFVRFMSAS